MAVYSKLNAKLLKHEKEREVGRIYSRWGLSMSRKSSESESDVCKREAVKGRRLKPATSGRPAAPRSPTNRTS